MGLLDEAIREHLELKRRRGADAGEVSREETEALGPANRDAEGTPDLTSLGGAPPPTPAGAEAYTGEHAADYETTQAHEPDWGDDATAIIPAPPAHDEPAAPYVPPAPYIPPAPAYEPSTAPTRAYEPPPRSYEAPPASPASYDAPSPAQRPPPPAFEPILPRSLTMPSSPPPAPPPPAVEPPAPVAAEPPPAEPPTRDKPRFGGLRRRRHAAADADEQPAGALPPPGWNDYDDDPIFDDPDPPTAVQEPPPAYQPPPAASYPPPPPAYPPPPPAYPPPPRSDPAGEDILEETPEFLEETPDHDRLWFEQRPPRDFDFDG